MQWIIPLIRKPDQHGFDIYTFFSLLDFKVSFLGSDHRGITSNYLSFNGKVLPGIFCVKKFLACCSDF